MNTYKLAWKEGETVLFVDASDCKYAAKNGNLAWRINNPGLVHHRSHSAKKNGAIGTWGKLAIFSNPLQGHQALIKWLHSKKIVQSDLYAIGKHYQPDRQDEFVQNLSKFSEISAKTKLKNLRPPQFESLAASIEELCGFTKIGNEEFYLLPKIAAKIECPGKKDYYLVGNDLTLTQDDAIDWIGSHHLDAVVVHAPNGTIHLRSRPHYQMQSLKLVWREQRGEEPVTLARAVGNKVSQQCVWGFINGIRNTRDEAIDSCNLISQKAGNELVFSLPNDRFLQGFKEVSVALILKLNFDTPIIKHAVQFLRHLLSLSKENTMPVVVFAHSQGAAIAEHALALLIQEERQKIRVFTFGGWSFIAPGTAHPESHNYASVGDLIPRIGSVNHQYLAIRKYEGLKKGLTHEAIIWDLAFGDAIHNLDSIDSRVLNKYAQERCKHYENEFNKISNVTVIDSESTWEHSFKNNNYQAVVLEIIKKYKNRQL